jgi:hypothetical protein
MADETPPRDTAPDPTPTRAPEVRAGRTLDLSTGKPPTEPKEPPRPTFTPLPPAEGDPEVRAGQTLDFSTGKPSSGRRKPAAASLGAGPVVRETLDLSTATPPAETPPATPPKSTGEAPSSKPKRSAKPKGKHDKGRGRPKPSGNSLAELLDPETLARLRGGS